MQEDCALAQLPGPCLSLAGAGPAEARRRHRTRRRVDARPAASPEDLIGYLRSNEIALTFDQAAGTCEQAQPEPQRHRRKSMLSPGWKARTGRRKRAAGRPALRQPAPVTIRHAGKRAAARLGLRAISACSGVWPLVLVGASAQVVN